MDWRIETDSLGEIKVPANKLWGAQTQRALEHFNIGTELIPQEMLFAYAITKKAAAIANHACTNLSTEKKDLICQVCDEILAGKHGDMFPLHVWISGSGTQFNMNINEVVANRCSQIVGVPLGSKKPVHPNDDVNMSQSTNDTFPTAMHIATAIASSHKLIPALNKLIESVRIKAEEWKDLVKIGRTHLQDATPLTLGQEFSGYASMLEDNLTNIRQSLANVFALTLGGTAVGTGINASLEFVKIAITEIAKITDLPFHSAKNKFAAQGAHNALVQFSASLKVLAASLFKIANDICLLASGPRCGINELILPANEPGSSIMPGKINPTQAEAISMLSIQVMANDVAISFGGASGNLEMNAYKPLIIINLMQSINLLADGMTSLLKFLITDLQPNRAQISLHLKNTLSLAANFNTALGYDNAAKIANFAYTNNLTLQEAVVKLGYLTSEQAEKILRSGDQ